MGQSIIYSGSILYKKILLPLVGDETAAHSPIKGFKKEDPRRLKSEAGWLKCEGCWKRI
jgi:hypothetical protein